MVSDAISSNLVLPWARRNGAGAAILPEMRKHHSQVAWDGNEQLYREPTNTWRPEGRVRDAHTRIGDSTFSLPLFLPHQETSQHLSFNGQVLFSCVAFSHVTLSTCNFSQCEIFRIIVCKIKQRKSYISRWIRGTWLLAIHFRGTWTDTVFSGHLFLNDPTFRENARFGQDVKFISNVTALKLSYE